jgi:rhomboid-like protein
MVGASGAVFGLLIAFAMMFPDVELMLIFLPIPIKAKYFVPFYALLELFFGVAGFQWDNVAHFAHLGGALFGFILVKYWKRNQFRIY